jgi:UDP-N-acetyl-D-glucosamine/UDP-N-acetyl-D-galactosamine dehydrogenase
MKERVGVVGLGYVGLPVALAFAGKFADTVGFDIDIEKIEELRRGHDRNHEQPSGVLLSSTLKLSSDVEAMKGCTFFVVAVPTPIDDHNVPDLSPVVRATEIVGRALSRGSVVVYESTVYPGVTEDLCGPLLEKVSGLKRGVDFTLGYSPERINPGDPQHSFEKITKIVSGEDSDTLERVASAYSSVVDAGVYRARSIRVAEAAKVIENTQRDLNIALMNELAIVFDRMGIRTQEVLEAAETKWNFLRFRPGLVGGHCVGVDPYYLTTKAQQLGYQPEVILAGRRINNNMGPYIAQRLVKLLVHANIPVKSARVGVLGVTFKENCSDLRNSKVPDILRELRQFGIEAMVNDPLASPRDAMHEHGVKLATLEEMERLDALVLAVSHRWYLELGQARLSRLVRDGGILVDVKSVMDPARVDRNLCYWSL